jgi:hypothetical protein
VVKRALTIVIALAMVRLLFTALDKVRIEAVLLFLRSTKKPNPSNIIALRFGCVEGQCG